MKLRGWVLGVLAGLWLGCGDAVDRGPDAPPSRLRAPIVANPTVECLSPANFYTVQLGAATQVPMTVTFGTNAGAELGTGDLSVVWHLDGVPLGGQQTTAPITYQLGYGEHLLTIALADGASGELLQNPTSRCGVRVRVTRACTTGADCDDAFVCNVTECLPIGGGTSLCHFAPSPEPGCCGSTLECPAGSFCDTAQSVCVACLEDAQCDDGSACTIDTCSGGTCTHLKPDPACCDCGAARAPDAQCDDGLACTVGACNCGTGTCTYSPRVVAGGTCCEDGDHAHCADGDPCTVDRCEANVCTNEPPRTSVLGCCQRDADCSDSNPCTVDRCDQGTHQCAWTASTAAGCCLGDAECDDGQATTLDRCVVGQCIHTDDQAYCVLPDQSAVVISELMINPSAVDDEAGEWIELYNATEAAIDLSGWALSDATPGAAPVLLSPAASLPIAPGAYLVLCRNADSAKNGGIACDVAYGDAYTLANADDEVTLLDATGAVHDRVAYDGGPNFPNPVGASIALVNPRHDNNVGARWKASTLPIAGSTDRGTPGAANVDVEQPFVVASCHEQPLDDPCTIDTCDGERCAHIAVAGCCNEPADCKPPTLCHVGQCTDHACSFTLTPAPECCLGHADCDDGLVCTVDRCLGGTCRHGPDPKDPGQTCCSIAEDCGTPNDCVAYACDPATHVCLPPELVAGASCCATNTWPAHSPECDDGDPSTEDVCKDFRCLSLPKVAYCDAQPGAGGVNNCGLDGDPCTDESCDVATKTCTFSVLPTCCQLNDECADEDPCTADLCDPKSGFCSHVPIPGCCLASAATVFCDDGDACTDDRCVGLRPHPTLPDELVGTCRHVALGADCCNVDGDCDDGQACTADTCDTFLHLCYFAPVAQAGCCDPDNATVPVAVQCDDGDACTRDLCLGGVCVHSPEPPTLLGECCDPAKGPGSVVCDDGEACTVDICHFGRCQHIGGAQGCCTGDLECDDGNACTIDACQAIGDAKVCTNTPISCDDGQFCNGKETCDPSGTCIQVLGSAPQIDDGIPCTQDACNEVSDVVTHVPNNAACNDMVPCTADVCDPASGCKSTLVAGFCAIQGFCYEEGAHNPLSACQVCDPAQNPTGWTGQSDVPEICNGQDDDCDGLTDEGTCGDEAPPAVGADIRFAATRGQPENISTTRIFDLTEPTQSGSVQVTAAAQTSPPVGFSVVAGPPAVLDVVVMRDVLYVDARETRIAAQVKDGLHRPVKTGTVVTASFTGPGMAATDVTCLTDVLGRCTLIFTVPTAVFDTGGAVTAQVTAGGLPAQTFALTANGTPGTLQTSNPGCGIELPRSPVFPGATFVVPLTLASPGVEIGGYDVGIQFDKLRLQVTSITAGSCGAFKIPVNNLALANSTGMLLLNDINPGSANPCAKAAKLEVARITFKALAPLLPDNPSSTAAVSAQVNDLYALSLTPMAQNQACEVLDRNGQSLQGTVVAWSAKVMGVHLQAAEYRLLDWTPITGVPETTQLDLKAYRRDFTEAAAASLPGTTFLFDPLKLSVSATGKVTPGSTAGAQVVTGVHQGFSGVTRLEVLRPTVELRLGDSDLQPVTGAVTPGGVQLHQPSDVRVEVAWRDGASDVFVQDISHLFDAAKFVVPAGLSLNPQNRTLSGTTAGSFPVSVRGAQGNTLATATLTVSDAIPAACTGLTVVAPCTLTVSAIAPAAPTVEEEEATLTARALALMEAYLQTCETQIFAHFDDGTTANVKGVAGMTVTSESPTVAASTPTGLLTALSGGIAQVRADWVQQGSLVCSGAAPVKVSLPAAVALEVVPQVSSLAIDPSDPAATLKGLPTSVQLQVLVHFADGTAVDFTTNPSTAFDATTADPADILAVGSTGVVTPTGLLSGTAKVRVQVGLYPGLGPAEATVHVVEASGLDAQIFEPYTPSLPRVPDDLFSYIEGTTTYQDGYYEVLLTFSDGSTVDVSTAPGLQVSLLQPGTGTPSSGVLALDTQTLHVTALGPGSADIRFAYGGMLTQISAFEVRQEPEGIAFLVPELLSGPTFSGIKDIGQTEVQVWCIFNDGTRRRLYGARFVPGLLSFGSTVPAAATIAATGAATIHGNRSTVFQVDIAPPVDAAPPYDPPAEVSVDCNLTPDCGDMDWGDTVGLAYKDRAPGQTFFLDVRTNSCDMALGAFDLTLTYDPTVLQVNNVEALGATVGEIFSVNWQGEPGHVLANAFFNPSGVIKKGTSLSLMRVHVTALKGGNGVSPMGAQVFQVVAIDAQTEIGPPTPRAAVAAVGDLDPDCPVPVPGDRNGDCAFDAADALAAAGMRDRLHLRRVLAGTSVLAVRANGIVELVGRDHAPAVGARILGADPAGVRVLLPTGEQLSIPVEP